MFKTALVLGLTFDVFSNLLVEKGGGAESISKGRSFIMRPKKFVNILWSLQPNKVSSEVRPKTSVRKMSVLGTNLGSVSVE